MGCKNVCTELNCLFHVKFYNIQIKIIQLKSQSITKLQVSLNHFTKSWDRSILILNQQDALAQEEILKKTSDTYTGNISDTKD